MRRRTLLGGGAAVVAAGAAGAGWWIREAPAAAPAVTGVPTGSAEVTKTDLSTVAIVPGTLGFVGAYTVYWQGSPGTVTWLPRPGQVIARGKPVFAVDNRPVRLLVGDRPAWRPLELGVSAGPDVRALERNLVALGHATAATMTVDGTFTRATAAAIRRWQRATHQTVTGRLELGAVTFQPGPLRVTTIAAAVGAVAQGLILSATSSTVAVTLAVPVTQTHLVHLRDKVSVTLPSGESVSGRVTGLSTVATAPDQTDPGRGGSQLPSVAATITLGKQTSAAALDQAPVDVNVTSESVRDVLAVPITALVALAGGGYGVYLLDGGARRLIGVTAGLFSDTLVEVKGDGLREGATVEVPAT
jgi:peptidoglycan hydrolase-like protein with peptidoglycan-binding domain